MCFHFKRIISIQLMTKRQRLFTFFILQGKIGVNSRFFLDFEVKS